MCERCQKLEEALRTALQYGLPPHDVSGARVWEECRAALAQPSEPPKPTKPPGPPEPPVPPERFYAQTKFNCPKCGHSGHNQGDCLYCTCQHQMGVLGESEPQQSERCSICGKPKGQPPRCPGHYEVPVEQPSEQCPKCGNAFYEPEHIKGCTDS